VTNKYFYSILNHTNAKHNITFMQCAILFIFVMSYGFKVFCSYVKYKSTAGNDDGFRVYLFIFLSLFPARHLFMFYMKDL